MIIARRNRPRTRTAVAVGTAAIIVLSVDVLAQLPVENRQAAIPSEAPPESGLVLTTTPDAQLIPVDEPEPEGFAIDIGPIPGLTTAWHRAPETTSIPLGATFLVKVDVPAGAAIEWNGAEPTTRTASASYALCVCEVLGSDSVSVSIDSRGTVSSDVLNLNVEAVTAAEIMVGDVYVRTETLDIPPGLGLETHNKLTVSYFYGPSIAAVREVGVRQYVTSIGRLVDFEVDVEPAGFAPLVEWRVNGNPEALGGEVRGYFAEVGDHVVTVGIAETAQVTFATYRTIITSHVVGEHYLPEGEPITVTAVTEPPGYENEITWLASTKYGVALPATGTGPSFTAIFLDTVGPLDEDTDWQWIGIKGNEIRLGQDQKEGACCLPDGSCLEMLGPQDCDNEGGVYQGVGTDCSQIACVGACCLPDGSCDEVAEAVCNDLGGFFGGNGTECAQTVCIGACCLVDGSCVVVSPSECADTLGGFYQGNDTDCESVTCEILIGACCLPDGMCVDGVTSDGCDALGGSYQGNATDCTQTTCVGACCLLDRSCVVASPSECEDDLGGFYQGNGTDCESVNCFGACCMPDATCVEAVDASACVDIGGISYIDGAECTEQICLGACCMPDTTCVTGVDIFECLTLGGISYTPGATCTETSCLGACCLPDGSCMDGVDVFQCSFMGGTAYFDGVDCSEASCNTGSCCLPDGSCVESVTSSECSGLGGIYQGNGSDCTVPCIGACCLPDGSCVDAVTSVGCADLGGIYRGNGTNCAQAPCVGACCMPDLSCLDDTSQVMCEGMGGNYQGNGSDCGAIECQLEPGFLGLEVELVDPVAEGWDLLGYPESALDTYRVYARFATNNGLITAIGDADGIFELLSSNGLFSNSPLGSDIPPNPLFVGVAPDLLWDTFVTIGETIATGPGGVPLTQLAPSAATFSAQSGGMQTNFGLDNAGWFVAGFPRMGDTVDNRVLVAQLTVAEGVEVSGLNWRVSGIAGDGAPFDTLACFPDPCTIEAPTAGGTDPCGADINQDGTVDDLDQVLMLECWGSDHAGADTNGNGVVGFDDLAQLLTTWGPCS